MNRFLRAALAVMVLGVLGGVAHAVWDSTTGNMPNFYPLCWGSGTSACLFGSSTNNQIGIGTLSPTSTLTVGGTFNSTGNSSVGGTLAVTGASTLTGNTTVGGTLAVTGALSTSGNFSGATQLGNVAVTTTTLLTTMPISTGAIVSVQFNTAVITYGTCISSGAGSAQVGAWVFPSTTTLNPGIPRACTGAN